MATMGQGNKYTGNYYFRNCFGYGSFKMSNTVAKGIPFLGKYSATGTLKESTNTYTFTENASSGSIAASEMSTKAAKTASSLAALKTEAKKALNNPAIWATDNIDKITSTTNTPDLLSSPILASKTRVTFTDMNGTAMTLAGGVHNPQEYELSEVGKTVLPVPATVPAGKKFTGWTLDKTSDKTVYTIFPANLYGNVVMYPVWEMTNVTVTVEAEVGTNSGAIADANVTAKYIGETVVTLKAKAAAPADLEKCKVTWSWYKSENGTETKLDGESGSTLELVELTTATYYAKVKIESKEELWRTNPSSDVKSNEYNVEIKKGELSPNGGITLKEKYTENGVEKDVYAYWGQPLSELTDKVAVTMQNTAGIAVSGTITWKEALNKVENVQKMYEAYFHPADTERYEDNTGISVTITPTILQRIYEFTISEEIDNKKFVYNEEYGKTYTKGEIAKQFEESYFGWLNEIAESEKSVYEAIVGRMPYFGGVDILQYGNSGEVGAYFDKEHVSDDGYIEKNKAANTAVLNIPVVFNTYLNSTKFTVTLFRTEQGGKLETTTQSLGYGATIVKPTGTLHITDSGTQFLTGWYESGSDGTIPEEKKGWDFASDRITGTTFISADWMTGYLRLTSISARVNGNSKIFTARSAAKATDYIVIGIYTVYQDENASDPEMENGNPQTVELVLSSEDYTVRTGAGGYHVGGEITETENGASWTGEDTVTIEAYNDKNEKLSATVTVRVKPITLDLRGVNFPNESKVYNGSTQSISAAEYDFASQGVVSNDYTVSYTYYDSGNQLLEGVSGVTEIGTYYVYLTFKSANKDVVSGKVSATFTITEQPIEVYVQWNADNQKEYTYNGQIQHPEATFYRKDGDGKDIPVTITFVYTGNAEQTNANADGMYSRVGVELRNSRYILSKDTIDTIEFRIARAKVALPQLSNDSFEYKASEYDISQYIGYNAETLEFLVRVENGKATDVPSGTITSNVYLRDSVNSEWADGSKGSKAIVWTITPKVMTVPTFTETLVYSGETYKIAEHLNFYDPVITVYGAETEASNAGRYRVNLRLPTANGGKNYVWESKEFSGTIDWQIQKTELYLTWEPWSYLYNGNVYSPRASIAFGLVEADEKIPTENYRFLYLGDTDKKEAGSYKIEVSIGQTSDLYTNYVIAKDSSVFYWVIKENANEVVITVVWDLPTDGGYTFNNEIQAPKVKALYSENGMGEANLDDYEIVYTGDWNKSKWRGSYTVGVEIKAYDGTPIRVRQGECSYIIRPNNGEGNPPTTNPEDPDDSNPEKPVEGTIQSIPQIVISGVSAVLILVFTIMTLNYVSVMNNAKRKAKKLAQISYSFAPMGLLSLTLGLTDMNWWIIAGVLMGVALFMAILMFVYRGKSKHALLLLEEEEERIEEEKEAARLDREAQARAEQQRRDDEFKMMFAAMQQNYQQPQMQYDDMKSLLAETVAGLLPTMQQQMQALPPAQSEADDLRAMMAQQQEMLNQLMQNQQTQQDYAAVAQDESVKTIFDTQPETEVVTLEESYGKLSDEEKRYYYEIGGYIMSKPETVQNDGKYAVLFKYRGRTLFKLFIKNNAPILAYVLDNNSQAEMIIDDETALDDAKQIVNMRTKRVDRELDR